MAGLGRGLNSLIPPKNTRSAATPVAVTPIKTSVLAEESLISKETAAVLDTHDKILQVGVERIIANSSQPRKEFADAALSDLAESIKEHGVLQPLVVIKNGQDYELIAGERRLRASKLAGLEKVPVIVREATEQQKLELALIENIQRENLNPIEISLSMRKLADEFNLNQEELAKRLGKSRSTVANILRLLNLPEEMQRALASGIISEGHAKILLGIENPVKQSLAFKKIVANKMSVAETTEMTRQTGGTKQAKVVTKDNDKEKEAKFREFFGAKTKIKRSQKGGLVVINFYSDEELEEMLKKI